MNGGNVILNLI